MQDATEVIAFMVKSTNILPEHLVTLVSEYERKIELKFCLEEALATNSDNSNLQHLYLLTLYYNNDKQNFEEIISYAEQLEQASNLTLLLQARSLMVNAGSNLSNPATMRQIQEAFELSLRISIIATDEDRFEYNFLKYIKAEYYFKTSQVDQAWQEIQGVEDRHPLVPVKLLREFIKFNRGDVNLELEIDSLAPINITSSDFRMLQDFKQKMQITINIQNAKEKLAAYNELKEQLEQGLDKLINFANLDNYFEVSTTLLQANLGRLEGFLKIQAQYGYQLLNIGSMREHGQQQGYLNVLLEPIYEHISNLQQVKEAIFVSFKQIYMTNIAEIAREEVLVGDMRKNYCYLLHPLFRDGEISDYSIDQLNRKLNRLIDEEWVETIIREAKKYSQVCGLIEYYERYIAEFHHQYGVECCGYLRTESGYVEQLQAMLQKGRGVPKIDPEAAGAVRSEAELLYVITDLDSNHLGAELLLAHQGEEASTIRAIRTVSRGFLVPQLERQNIWDKFAFEYLETEMDAGRHQVIMIENVLPAKYDKDGQEIQPALSLHAKREPYSPGMEFVVNSLQRQLDNENAMPIMLAKFTGISPSNYGQVTYYQFSTTIQGTRLDKLLQEKQILNNVNKVNFSTAFITSILVCTGDAKPDNIMVRHYKNPFTGKDEAKLIFVDSDIVSFTNNHLHYITGKDGYKKFYSEMLNVLLFFEQMKEPVAAEVVSTLTENDYVAETMIAKWLADIYEQNQNYQEMLENGWDELDFQRLKLPIKLPPHAAVKSYMKLKTICQLLQHNKEMSHHKIFKLFYPAVSLYYQSLQDKDPLASISNLYQDVYEAIGDPNNEELKQLYNQSIIAYQTRIKKTITMSKVPSDQSYHLLFSQKIAQAIDEFTRAIDLSNISAEFGAELIRIFYFVEHITLVNASKEQVNIMFTAIDYLQDKKEVIKLKELTLLYNDHELKDKLERGIAETNLKYIIEKYEVNIITEYFAAETTQLEQLERFRKEAGADRELSEAGLRAQYDNILDHIIDEDSVMLAGAIATFEKNIQRYKNYSKVLFDQANINQFAMLLLDHPLLAGVAEILIEQKLLGNDIYKLTNRHDLKPDVAVSSDVISSLLNNIIESGLYQAHTKRQLATAIIRQNPAVLIISNEEGKLPLDIVKTDGDLELMAAMINAVATADYEITNAIILQAMNNVTAIEQFNITAALLGMPVTAQEFKEQQYDHSKRTEDNDSILHLILKQLITEKQQRSGQQENILLYYEALEGLKVSQENMSQILWDRQITATNEDYQEIQAIETRNKVLPKYNIWDLALLLRNSEILEDLYYYYRGEEREELQHHKEQGMYALAEDDDTQFTRTLAGYYQIVNWPITVTEAIDGIDLTKVNERGQTILHEILLLPDCIIRARLQQLGNTAVEKAAIIEQLIMGGANPNITAREDGLTALQLAAKSGQFSIVEVFINHLEQSEVIEQYNQLKEFVTEEETTTDIIKKILGIKEEEPDLVKVRNQLEQIIVRLSYEGVYRDTDYSFEVTEKIHEIKPNLCNILSQQGKADYKNANYKEALNKFTEAQNLIEKLNSQLLIKILFMKAQTEQKLNMHESALEDYVQIYKISPKEFYDLDLALLGEE